ncbi:CheF family chemotaxis protein [Halorientalis sp.]|jgi:CheY-like chemotaxis protein|uniref:CheF family chemotaxis protein n=1 Tax=Halorientalis sp. TaxID=1931229 RepID=UPI00262A9727|nr:CheF family chemotaxis protein [Halorientalis sp.]
MSEAVADFNAETDSSRSDTDGFESTRVLISESQVVFATGDTQRTVPVSDIFDLSQGVGQGADANSRQSLTIAFRDGEIRETVTIRCQGGTLENFQLVLYKLLFDGTDVRIRSDEEAGERLSDGTLAVTRSAVRLRRDGETLAIRHDDVAGFETGRKQFGDSEQPVVFVYWAGKQRDAKTAIVLSSFRLLNLLGRYMQSYATVTAGESTHGSVNVLLVDDDPHDLEMAEMLLSEQEPELSIETATSAAGGREALADDGVFHCVVSDYDMPGVDGIEFLKQVRASHPDLPFILFTGQGSEAVAKQALLSDVTDYVEKGIGSKQYEVLADRIQGALY